MAGVAMTGGALVFSGFEAALPVFVGSVMGTICTPDMDLNAALPVSFMTKIPGVRLVWGTVWRPYQLLFKHRSFFTHFPFVGTTGRALYLLLWILGLFWILGAAGLDIGPEDVLLYLTDNRTFWIVAFGAWCVQDIVHFILDI